MIESIKEMLLRHEGLQLMPYIDSRGHWTVGVGHNLNKPITQAAAMQIFDDDVKDAINDCTHAFPWFSALDQARQAVMVNLMFNLGHPRLMKFVNFLRCMELGEYDQASYHLLDSQYAQDVKGRAHELAGIIRGPVQV